MWFNQCWGWSLGHASGVGSSGKPLSPIKLAERRDSCYSSLVSCRDLTWWSLCLVALSFLTSHFLALGWGDALQSLLKLSLWKLLMISRLMVPSVTYVRITPEAVSLGSGVGCLPTAAPLVLQPQRLQNGVPPAGIWLVPSSLPLPSSSSFSWWLE